jgi:hypothetical protein
VRFYWIETILLITVCYDTSRCLAWGGGNIMRHANLPHYILQKCTWSSVPHLFQLFNHEFLHHLPLVVTYKYNPSMKLLFWKILSLQNNKWCEFPSISQNWTHHSYSLLFMSSCFDKYSSWTFFINCSVGQYIKKHWDFIFATHLS